MIFLKLLVATCVAIQNVVRVQTMDPATVSVIVKSAVELSAPFTKTASNRLHNELFGNDRAARSSDVVINNKSNRKFTVDSTSCKWGGFSRKLFPEFELPPHSSTIYGIESNGFLSGVECTVTYRDTTTEQWFSLYVDNSYIGHNKINYQKSGNFRIIETLGQGNNNDVRFLITE